VTTRRNKIFKEPKLTIGLDLGDRTSHYCILNEAVKQFWSTGCRRHPRESSKSSVGSRGVESRQLQARGPADIKSQR
jgi:hypothetical protein